MNKNELEIYNSVKKKMQIALIQTNEYKSNYRGEDEVETSECYRILYANYCSLAELESHMGYLYEINY